MLFGGSSYSELPISTTKPIMWNGELSEIDFIIDQLLEIMYIIDQQLDIELVR